MSIEPCLSEKYSAYPEYKDSGDAWLGSIPSQWQITRIKHISELTPKKPDINRELKCSFLPMEKLKTDSITLDEVRSVNDVYDGYTYFADQDILMAKVTPCFENKNIAVAEGLVNQLGFGSSEIYVLRVGPKATNRYLFYRLQEDSFMDISTAAMTGAGGLKRVPSETVNNFITSLPCIEEQQQIANFLDHETAKIDTLIEKQQQLIKLLKEKRQAVISHAVTKGLNPDAPMKDSGVEWLGEVPEHWVVTKLYHYTTRIGDGLHSTPKYQDDTSYYFVNGNNLVEGTVSVISAKEVPESEYQKHLIELNERTLFLSINGTIGNLAVYQGESIILGKSAAFINCNESLQRGFLYYYLQSDQARQYFDQEVTGTTIFNLSLNSIRQMKLVLPIIQEQQSIIEFCKSKTKRFDELISKSERAISLIKERRKALISAAVTGKIDVRNWKPENHPAHANAS